MDSYTVGRCGEPWRAGMGSWAIGREVKVLEGGQAEPASDIHTGSSRISSKWLNKDLSAE